MTLVDVIYFATLFETFSAAKEPSKYPLLEAWFNLVSKNEKMIAGIEFIKEQVRIASIYIKKKKSSMTHAIIRPTRVLNPRSKLLMPKRR